MVGSDSLPALDLQRLFTARSFITMTLPSVFSDYPPSNVYVAESNVRKVPSKIHNIRKLLRQVDSGLGHSLAVISLGK
jgi:hypothetical protein